VKNITRWNVSANSYNFASARVHPAFISFHQTRSQTCNLWGAKPLRIHHRLPTAMAPHRTGIVLAIQRALELGLIKSQLSAAVAWQIAAQPDRHGRVIGATPRALSTATRDRPAGAPFSGNLTNPDAPASFAFDIDGVLIRGREVLAPAREAMQLLVRCCALRGAGWLPHVWMVFGSEAPTHVRNPSVPTKPLNHTTPRAAPPRPHVARSRGVPHQRRRHHRGGESGGAVGVAGRARQGGPGGPSSALLNALGAQCR